AAVFTWIGRTKLENRAGDRSGRHCRVRRRLAIWAQRRRPRLFGDADTVAHSTYRVVRSWHPDCPWRCVANRDATPCFRPLGRRRSLWSPILLRAVRGACAKTPAGRECLLERIPGDALVRHGTENLIRRPRPRME